MGGPVRGVEMPRRDKAVEEKPWKKSRGGKAVEEKPTQVCTEIRVMLTGRQQ